MAMETKFNVPVLATEDNGDKVALPEMTVLAHCIIGTVFSRILSMLNVHVSPSS
jgi:hypothetical protein